MMSYRHIGSPQMSAIKFGKISVFFRSFKPLLILISILVLRFFGFQTAAAPGDVDLRFDAGSGINGGVLALAIQPDGKVLIGGEFSAVRNGVQYGIARLLLDGSADPTFNARLSGAPVNKIALQADGRIIVGGFISTNGTNQKLARLNPDGTFDSSFSPSTVLGGGGIWSIAILMPLPDGKVFIGGTITNAGGLKSDFVSRLNSDGYLDLGFRTVAAIDGTISTSVRQSNGKIVVGGSFTNFDATGQSYLVRLTGDGLVDGSFFLGKEIDSAIYGVLLLPEDKLLCWGNFTNVNGSSQSFVARLSSDGRLDATFQPVFDRQIYSIGLQPDNRLVVGGVFTSINGSARTRVARLNSDGTLDLSFDARLPVDDSVQIVDISPGGEIVLGGSFQGVGIARLNSSGNLDTGFIPNTGPDASVRTVAIQAGKAIIGGAFKKIGTASSNRIARLNDDGSLDSTFSSTVTGTIYSVAVQEDQKIVVGGLFGNINGLSRNGIARLNPDGSLDTSFNPGTTITSSVTSVAAQPDGKTLVGGMFFSFNGVFRQSIARLKNDGTVDTGFTSTAVGTVQCIALQPDGKILIGGTLLVQYPTSYNPGPARLNPDGRLDSNFIVVAKAGTQVYAIAVQSDGKVLIGGQFTTIAGASRNGIARVNPDGSLDATFDPGTGVAGPLPSVNAIVIQPDQKILIGGSFFTFNGVPRSWVARLNNDGSLDQSFNSGTGPNSTVYSIARGQNGTILIGGDFSGVDGVARGNVARLVVDSIGDSVIRLTVLRTGSQSSLIWSNSYILQEASTVDGLFMDVPTAGGPYSLDFGGSQHFFRLRSKP